MAHYVPPAHSTGRSPRGPCDPPRAARTKSFLGSVRPRSRAAFPCRASPTVVLGRDAGRLGAHYGVEPRVLRLRNAPALRHREAPGPIRGPLARVAPDSCCERVAHAPALPLAHDAVAAAARDVAPLARTAHRYVGALRPRTFGDRARVRCERRRGRERRVPPFRSDRCLVRSSRDPRGTTTRSRLARTRDAARRGPDERRGHLTRADPRFRRRGNRS